MRTSAVFAAATLFVAVPAFAQSSSTTSPAIANPKDVNKTTAAPVPGKNSFTEREVTSRLEANGYTQISGLKKDDQSIWRGKAMKSGGAVNVAVDYQGNITQQ